METFISWLMQYADVAHWFIFGALILAGFNLPLSADLIIILSAFLGAAIVPEHLLYLYGAVVLGCIFSAWCAYWVGRLLGNKLKEYRWFAKILSPDRLEKIRGFYEKHGLLTLIIGRFIPFGVRNCIFMTTGMSKIPFSQFVMRDAIACFIWASSCFFLFYTLGQNYQVLYQHMKTFNLLIFSSFSLAVIGFVWYKRRKRIQSTIVNANLSPGIKE